MNFGYARNPGFDTVGSFDAIYGGVQLQRTLGRTASVYVNYNVQRQTSGIGCALCSADLMRHVIGVGFDWHMRPILFH